MDSFLIIVSYGDLLFTNTSCTRLFARRIDNLCVPLYPVYCQQKILRLKIK